MDVIFAPDWQDETLRKRLGKSLARMGVLHTEIESLHAGVQCWRRPDVIDVGSLVPLIAVLISDWAWARQREVYLDSNHTFHVGTTPDKTTVTR